MNNRTHDIGLSEAHGINGKGDSPRYDHNDNWEHNYDAIDWGRQQNIFQVVGYRKFRKVYPSLKYTEQQIESFGAALAATDRATENYANGKTLC